MKQKIQNIQKKIGKLTKDVEGYNYKYADLNQLLEKLKPLLEEEKLVLTQPLEDGKVVTRISEIVAKEGEIGWTWSEVELPKDVKPQDLGSAITYFRRYTLMSLLALETEDDDGKSASDSKPTGGYEKVADKKVREEKNTADKEGGVTPF